MDKATFDRLSGMDYRDIFRICREDPALDSDSPDVQFLLALCVRDGRGIRKDEKTFQRVLEWCIQKGSHLAIGYQAGFESGRLAAMNEAKSTATPKGSFEEALAAADKKMPESEKTPREPEKTVTVLFLTRPSVKKQGFDASRKDQKRAGSDFKASESGWDTAGGQEKKAKTQSAYTGRASSVLDQLYFVADEDRSGRGLSEDYLRIHRTLATNDAGRIRDFWECGEYDGFLARMPEDERGEVLADLLIKINHFQKNNQAELVNLCRKMALRILEGKVYISDLQLSTKNEDGEKEGLPVLWFAVWLGDLVLARYLLRGGANPNLVRSCRISGGVTLNRYALGECILQGNQPMARLLLDYGANARKMDGRKGDDGSESLTSPLAYAVLRNSPESVLLLLEKGIDPNEGYHFRDKEGKWHLHSALYLAVQHTKNIDIVRILLEGGANPGTAGSLANVQGEMLRVLLKHN